VREEMILVSRFCSTYFDDCLLILSADLRVFFSRNCNLETYGRVSSWKLRPPPPPNLLFFGRFLQRSSVLVLLLSVP